MSDEFVSSGVRRVEKRFCPDCWKEFPFYCEDRDKSCPSCGGMTVWGTLPGPKAGDGLLKWRQ